LIQDQVMSEPLWCKACDRYPSGETTIEVTRTFEGHVFKANLDAQRCLKCRKKFLKPGADKDFDRRMALRLTQCWPPRPTALRLIREVIGLPAKELAALLGITPETVSRWEHGRLTPGRQTLAVLAELVESPKRSQARRTLDALRYPRPLPPLILLDRN
jgi:putative zinc finger/helix-turn-helix YgiT family protein